MRNGLRLKAGVRAAALGAILVPVLSMSACLWQHAASGSGSRDTYQEEESPAVRLAKVETPGFTRDEKAIQAKIARKTRKSKEGKKPENPKKRAWERYRDRAGEGGVYAFQDVLRAKAQMDAMPLKEASGEEGIGVMGGGIRGWEWLGPGNIGGRIRALVIHPAEPNRMWVGGVSGGIWRTTNGGAYWTPVNDFLPSLAVSCMAIDPDDPDVLYAGTGEGFGDSSGASNGAGLLKSTDGGATWSQLPMTANWSNVNRIAIHPSDTRFVLTATDLGIYRSYDGGDYWERKFSGQVLDLKYASSTRLVAGLDNGKAIYSEDGGMTWKEAAMTGATNIFNTHLTEGFKKDDNDDDDILKVASTAGFVKGDTVKVGTTEQVEVKEIVDDNTLKVADLANNYDVDDFVSNVLRGRVELGVGPNQVVYASINVGGGTIWRSEDEGKTYNLVARSDQTPNYFITSGDRNGKSQGEYDNALWVDPNNRDFIVVGGIDLWRSTTGGTNLEKISDWLTYHLGISAHADHHLIQHHPNYNGSSNKTVYVANDGGIQRTDDIKGLFIGGSGWVNLANNLGITQFYGGCASPGGSIIAGGCQDNGNLKLDANGGTEGWYQCADCTGDGGFCAINFKDPRLVFTTTQNLSIWKSENGGGIYTPATLGLDEAGVDEKTRFIAPLGMHPDDPNVLVAGGTKIWRTDNGAWTWSAIRGPIANSRFCSTIEMAPGVSYRIWVGYEDGTVSRTTNSVTNWVNVDDNGPNPLPNARTVTDIAVNPLNINEVFVSFGGFISNSVWFTSDNGSTWQLRTGTGLNALPWVHVNTITFHPSDPNLVYAGTDIGVFTSDDKGLTWNKISDGPVNTEVRHLFWQGDNLIAATHGRGMYRTKPVLQIYVDWTNTGYEDGTYANPYNTIKEGVGASWPNATISIRGGEYDEVGDVIIDKSLDLKARGDVTIR